MFITKFPCLMYRPGHLSISPNHLSTLFRNSLISENSQPTTSLQRNYHFSAPKKNNKDPSKYSGQKINPENISGYSQKDSNQIVRRFRQLEDKVKSTLGNLPPQKLKEREKSFWPDRKLDEYKFLKKFPNAIDVDDDKQEPPFEDLNLDDDSNVTKAMSYISYDDNPIATKEEGRFPICETLRIRRHSQVTAGGRVFSFSALVMLGTGRGTAGLGYARGNTVPEAIEEAKREAEKNLISLDLWRGYHIGADIKMRYKKSYMFMKAHAPGYGRRPTAWDMDILLDAFGISDASIGWGGSRNKHTRYRAIFLGLRDKTRSPEKVARMLGRKLFNRAGAFYHTYD